MRFPYRIRIPLLAQGFFISSRMTRTHIGLLGAAIVLALGAGAWAMNRAPEATVPETATSTPQVATSSSEAPATKPAPIFVRAGSTDTAINASGSSVAAKVAAPELPTTATLSVDGVRFALHAAAGSTLETAMAQLRSEGRFSYATEAYPGLGAFVTEIQGRAGGSGHYWILYVNGKKSATGISSTRIRSGDVIEWKLEKSY
jgi:hypothetical protein